MKLISMTDFLPKHPYSIFLKQPLEIWMFVPCDENGNVFEKPIDFDYFETFNVSTLTKQPTQKQYKEWHTFKDAKERCLFEGFEFDNPYVKSINYGFHVKAADKIMIEDLVKYNLQLTQTAIKQLGL